MSTNWSEAILVDEDGSIETWRCFCHNGLEFKARSKVEAEHERSQYYNP